MDTKKFAVLITKLPWNESITALRSEKSPIPGSAGLIACGLSQSPYVGTGTTGHALFLVMPGKKLESTTIQSGEDASGVWSVESLAVVLAVAPPSMVTEKVATGTRD